MAPQSDWESVKATIEAQLGLPIDEVYLRFDKEPISSASIAQVHVAYLKSGEKVAVKVQHPWLREELAVDTKMTEIFVRTAQLLFKEFDYEWLLLDLQNNLPKELDFTIEASNSHKMKELFKNYPQIQVPKIYKELSGVKSSLLILRQKL